MKHRCELRFRSLWAFTHASLSRVPFASAGLFLLIVIKKKIRPREITKSPENFSCLPEACGLLRQDIIRQTAAILLHYDDTIHETQCSTIRQFLCPQKQRLSCHCSSNRSKPITSYAWK